MSGFIIRNSNIFVAYTFSYKFCQS
ncbi:hypothetical protein LEMLEM_LOCUS8897 [Lemmus lemmus]